MPSKPGKQMHAPAVGSQIPLPEQLLGHVKDAHSGGAQPSLDELGSSMLRELLDSPSPPLLPMQQQTAPRCCY